MSGKVYLVGAGPGHVDLITARGIHCLKEADIILYDRLVHPQLLRYANDHAELIFVGKFPNYHVLRQEKINQLLVEKAMAGHTVVRLKGGDPSVFGRVGEEAEELAKHEIEFEIVPGVTSGIAASAYAGIPVTHRNYGQTFSFVTGHDQSENGKPSIPWEALAKGMDTIAFYMGITHLHHIAEQLIHYGKEKQTPVAVIQWGTMGAQRTVVGTLESIVTCVMEEGVSNPAIVLVGDVVQLREKIYWFEKKPLFNQTMLVAKASDAGGKIASELIRLGADVIEFPRFQTIKNRLTIEDWQTIRSFSKLAFTSKQSVDYFFEQLNLLNIDCRETTQTIYAFSHYTKQALKDHGFHQVYSQLDHEEEALWIGDSTRVGMHQHHVFVYEQTFHKEYNEAVLRWIKEKPIDQVVFPNSTAVHAFVHECINHKFEPVRHFSHATFYCMGKKSTKAAIEAGFSVIPFENSTHTTDFIEAIVEHCQRCASEVN